MNPNHPHWIGFSSYRAIHIITDILQSVVGITTLATGWTIRGSKPGTDEIFPTRPDRPGAHPASCTVGTGSHTGGKAVGAWVAHVTLNFLPLLILLLWGMYPNGGSTFISFNLTHVRQWRSCPCTKLSTPPWRSMIQLPTYYEEKTNGTNPVPEAQFAEQAVAHSMSGIVLPFVQTVARLLNSATLFHQYSKMIPIFCFRALGNLTRSCISVPNMKLCRPQKRTQWGRTVDPPAGFDVQERNEEFVTGLYVTTVFRETRHPPGPRFRHQRWPKHAAGVPGLQVNMLNKCHFLYSLFLF